MKIPEKITLEQALNTDGTIVSIHPYYSRGNFTQDYEQKIMELLTSFKGQSIILEEENTLSQTRKKLGEDKDYVPTIFSDPEPVKGWEQLFQKISENTIILCGGYWHEQQRFLGDTITGCLGFAYQKLVERFPESRFLLVKDCAYGYPRPWEC